MRRMFIKSTQNPWCTKAEVNPISSSSKSRKVVFIYQLMVITPGLIGKVTEFLNHP